jgi:hypothetical protein
MPSLAIEFEFCGGGGMVDSHQRFNDWEQTSSAHDDRSLLIAAATCAA